MAADVETRLVLLAAALVCAALPTRSPAAPRHPVSGLRQAEAEARAYLPACPPATDKRRQLCLLTERNFIEQYVMAKAGDPLAMGSTAFSFDQNAESEDFKRSDLYAGGVGRPFDAVQACAWRQVIARLPEPPHGQTDAELADSVCGRLGAKEAADARKRVEVLEKELTLRQTPVPSESWEPAMPGLRGG